MVCRISTAETGLGSFLLISIKRTCLLIYIYMNQIGRTCMAGFIFIAFIRVTRNEG